MAITIYYWGPSPQAPFYGRAIGIYAALNQAGADFEVKGIADLPANGAFALPCIDIDGLVIGQTPAILMTLGQKFGLAGESAEETARVNQAVLDFNDVFGEHKTFKEKPERAKQWFSYLEATLSSRETGWIAGTKEASVADFHGVFACEFMLLKEIDFTSDYPAIAKWWESVKAVPGVKKLYDSLEPEGKKMVPNL